MLLDIRINKFHSKLTEVIVRVWKNKEYFSMQTGLDTTMAPLKNNYFEIALFSFWTLKTALRKQHYLCQKFLLPIPIHTWKISWIERLIYFLWPHMGNWSRLTLMWQSNVYHGIVFQFQFSLVYLFAIEKYMKRSKKNLTI